MAFEFLVFARRLIFFFFHPRYLCAYKTLFCTLVLVTITRKHGKIKIPTTWKEIFFFFSFFLSQHFPWNTETSGKRKHSNKKKCKKKLKFIFVCKLFLSFSLFLQLINTQPKNTQEQRVLSIRRGYSSCRVPQHNAVAFARTNDL